MTADIVPSTQVAANDMDDSKPEASSHLEAMKGTPSLDYEAVASAASAQNPRNWPLWKKNIQIVMVAFHSMMGTFTAAGIIPAYDSFAEMYNVSVPVASYLTSFQVR